MAKQLIELENTGLVIGDLTFDWCKKLSDNSSVSTAAATLTERSGGFYILNITVTEDTDFKVHVTADSTKYAVGILSPADGDLARQTTADIIAADVAGLDGAAMRGTDNAALASVCTEARLAELDPVNLPADVASLGSPMQAGSEVVASNMVDVSGLAQESTLLRGLGLMMENHVEDDIVRNSQGLKTSSNFYLYDSKAHALTHDKSTGLLATYTVAVTYNAAWQITLFKVMKN